MTSPPDHDRPARARPPATVAGDLVQGDKAGGDKVAGDKITIYQTVAAPLDRQQQRNRQAMLKKVRLIWIEGLLDQSLANELRIALDLTEHPDAVALPLNALVQELRHPPRPLPTGTPIITVFDQMNGALLILGAPGAGKTTLMLELARDLIARAEHDERHPIPVVFNLSSWAEKRRPLSEWLVEELNTKYDVPRRVAQAWIDADEVLPLLDGLDEVAAEQRNNCVAAINTYREEHGLVPLAVCSRAADYEALIAKLRLQGAVIVQTLTPQQVEAYLEHTGEKLAGVRAALRDDAELRAMLDTPLMLSIVTLAYKDTPVEALQLGGTEDQQRRHLFDAYIAAMFQRRSEKVRYSQQQTLHWLSSLAREMQRQAQTVFLVERLQPDWLPTRVARLEYVLLDRLVIELVCGLVIGLVYGLVFGLVFELRAGLVNGLSAGLVALFFGGRTDIETLQQRPINRTIVDALIGGLVGELVYRLVFGLVGELVFGLSFGMFAWLLGGPVGVLFGVLTGKPSLFPRQVVIIERLHWIWSKARRSVAGGLGGGLCIGLVFGLGVGLSVDLVYGLGVGLVGGLGGGLVFGLVGGLNSGPLTATIRANQGIRRSARSALVYGLGVGLIFGLVFGLVFGLGVGLLAMIILRSGFSLYGGVFYGLFYGPVGALCGALSFGGYAFLSHLALRLVLYRNGFLPLHLVPFLDHCAERIFLRKVGGGYIFVHRLLMEHFASLHESAPPPTKEAP